MQRFVVSILILFGLPLAAIAVGTQDSSMVGEQQGYAYDKTTFSNQSEILDFIKTLDFEKNPPLKKLSDFYNDEKTIPDDKVLRKGVDLYQKGKVKKALDYFYKISRNSKKYSDYQIAYATWQIYHYQQFGILDIYFNGTPSRMDRLNTKEGEYDKNVYLYRFPSLGMWELCLMADPQLHTYYPERILNRFTDNDSEYVREYLCYTYQEGSVDYSIYKGGNPEFTREFLAAVLYEAFPKDRDIKIYSIESFDDYFPSKYYFSRDSRDFLDEIKDFLNVLDCMHLLARTNSNKNDYYGIGLTANELYEEARKLNPDKQFDIFDYNSYKKYKTDNDVRCFILLLRSAYYGHIDAMFELLPYIVEVHQHRWAYEVQHNKFWKKEYRKDNIDTDLWINRAVASDVYYFISDKSSNDCLSNLRVFKEYPYIWDAMAKIAGDAKEQLSDNLSEHWAVKEAEKRAKKERRARFWSNLAGAMLEGIAAATNTYMAAQYYGSTPTPMNTVIAPHGGSHGSLADAMSQPGYFQQEQQRLLQLSMNQVQWAEMQEFNQARESCQRMGRDLSLDEFRANKGQAIMDLKEQGVDIIAEQNAANRDM